MLFVFVNVQSKLKTMNMAVSKWGIPKWLFPVGFGYLDKNTRPDDVSMSPGQVSFRCLCWLILQVDEFSFQVEATTRVVPFFPRPLGKHRGVTIKGGWRLGV